MSYIEENKAAWEEAFEHRRPGWGEKDHERLLGESLPFFCPDVAKELRRMDFTGRAVAQFCCNNGRELLSLMGLGPAEGVGFDIAENIIAQAVDTAEKAGVRNCRFVACNILDIPPEYRGRFDLIFFTIGAITWFEDLAPLFRVVSDCLKPGGVLLIHDFHPVMNMLPLPGEPEFDAGDLNRISEGMAAALEEEGMTVTAHPWLPDCLVLTGTGDLTQGRAWQTGMFYPQDPAARLAVLAAGLLPGNKVLDACAAPGGKSFAAAMTMGDQGELYACDLHAHKKALIEAGAARLGLGSITAQVLDARKPRKGWEGTFDTVLADVPCSGLGVIRKKPEIRYKPQEELAGLPALQGEILDNVAHYVKPGGVLLYSTCTLRPQENEAVVRAFLASHGGFSLEGFRLPGPMGEQPEGVCTLWPQRLGTDGFFLAKFRRREDHD